MEGGRRKSKSTSSLQRKNSSRQIAEQFTGAGKSFTVKSLGSEAISQVRGDAVAADCIKRLKVRCAEAKVKKLTNVIITLQLKRVTFLNEKTKSVILKVPVERVTYVCHDPLDTTVFAVIVRSDEGSGLKLHAFQADLKTAISFVHSARELFQLVYKLVRVKRRLSGQQTTEQEATGTTKDALETPAKAPRPLSSATKDSSSIDHGADRPSEPSLEEESIYSVPGNKPATTTISTQDRKKAVLEEWQKLEAELNQIAKDLGMEDKPVSNPTPTFQPYLQPSPAYTRVGTNPFDPNVSASSDPFSDEFFQKSFDTPSAQNVTGGSFVTSGHSSGSPVHFTSTPEGQQQDQSSLSKPTRPDSSAIVDPFGSDYRDPFQDSFGTVGQPDFAATLPTPQQRLQTSSLASTSPFSQPSSSFLNPTQHSLSFSPDIGGASQGSTATGSGYNDSFSAGNPFAADSTVPSFPFGADPFGSYSAPGSFTTQPLVDQSTGSASFKSDGSDPFADLLPQQLGPVLSPVTEQGDALQHSRVATPPSMSQSKQTWDTFQSPTDKAQTSGFEDSFEGQTQEQTSGLFVSPRSNGQKGTAVTFNGGFEDSFHTNDTFPNADKSASTGEQQLLHLVTPFEGSATAGSARRTDIGFDDHFVQPFDSNSQHSNTLVGTGSSKSSWISFS